MNGEDRFDEWIAKVAAGEIAADDERVQALVGSDPERVRDLNDAAALSRLLKEARQTEHDILFEASSPSQEEEALVEATLRPLLKRQPPQASSRFSSRWLKVLIAASLLGLAYLGFEYGSQSSFLRTDPDSTLNKGEIELLEPQESVMRFSTFRWNANVPQGGWVDLLIESIDVASSDPIRIRSLRAQEWTPESTQINAFKNSIQWTLIVFDGAGNEVSKKSRISRVIR